MKCTIIKVNVKIHIVMELINADPLSLYVNSKGYLIEYEACQIMRKILQGILFLHQNLTCHRDLKPDNILTKINGEPLKIIDFNICKKNKK